MKKLRRDILVTIGTAGSIALAGCTGDDDSENGSSANIEFVDGDVDTTDGETRGTYEFTNEGDEEGSADFGTELRVGTDGLYGTYTNEMNITVGPGDTTTEELVLIDRSGLPEVVDEELNNGYFELEYFLDGDQIFEQELGDQPSRHVSFRVLYDGTWQGAVGPEGSVRNIQGEGDAHLAVDNDAIIVSGNAQKNDDSGRELIVQIIVDGDVIAEEATTAGFGVAQVAAEASESPISNPREPYEPDELV